MVYPMNIGPFALVVINIVENYFHKFLVQFSSLPYIMENNIDQIKHKRY